MIYFTSDTHFNHDRQFIYKPRGFDSIKDADATIINNWNNLINDTDDVYVLGDFCLGSDLSYVNQVVNQLNGKIHLIRGNHDTDSKIKLYEKLDKIVEIVWATQIKYKNRLYYLSHYPTHTADLNSNPNRAVINLFGHTHSKDVFYEDRPYMYNVAVDAHDNKPVSIDDICKDVESEIVKCFNYMK